jgi:hypothetical protein
MAKLVALAPVVLLEVLVVMLWAKMALQGMQAQVLLPAKQGQMDQRQLLVQRDWVPQRRAHPAATALQARRANRVGPAHMAKPVAPVWRLTRTVPRVQPLS